MFAPGGGGGARTTSDWKNGSLNMVTQMMGGGRGGGGGMGGGMGDYMTMAQSLLADRQRAARAAEARSAEAHDLEMRERKSASKEAGRQRNEKRREKRRLRTMAGRRGIMGYTSSGPDPYGIGRLAEDRKRTAFKEQEASDRAMYEALLAGM